MATLARGLHPRSRIDEYRERGWWSDRTLDRVFADQVAIRGDAIAIADPANRAALLGSSPRRLTWHELDDEVTFLAARLLEHGITRGDVVGVQLPNTIELAEVYLAGWMIGAVVSPLAMQYRERELTSMASKAEFALFITTGSFGGRRPAESAEAVRAELPQLRAVLTFGASSDAGGGDGHITPDKALPDDREKVAAYRRAERNDPNDCVTICWTSGTTGEPKGVPRTHYDWLAFTVSTIGAPHIVADDVLLNPFPMINMAGICGMFLPWICTGATLIQHHPFDAATFFGQIAGDRVTYTLAPPALLWKLLNDDALLNAVDISTLTRVGSGSAPLQPAMVRGWQEKHGLNVINFFGSNEGISLLSDPVDFPDPDTRARFFPRYGTPGVSWESAIADRTVVKLVDLETGAEITEPGHPGELLIGGPGIFPGYLDGANLPSPFDADGLLKTGDIFEIDGEKNQYLRYVDRCKDLIIRGGMNIAPAELEGLIAEHPAVADAAVIGDADDALGETVAAVVVLNSGRSLTLDELSDFLKSHHIASFKLPERLEIREVLPRNAVGKLMKRELRVHADTR